MRKDCAFTLARMDQRVVAASADRDLNELLEVEFGAPMFMVENVYTAAGGRPVAVSHLYLRGDRYSYQASISLRDEA
jgi:DNA-binding GntR family transcriptional regulator